MRRVGRWMCGCLLLVSPLAAEQAAVELTPCAEEVGVSGGECGTVQVYEDRAAAQGRRIDLKVVVLPALSRERQPDPVFLLAGGPGMAATEMAEMAERVMRRLREKRDIVLVDQRGTGESNPLDCDLVDADSVYFLREGEFPYQRVRDCLAGLDADPRLYTTPIAMDDLDDVRAALGYETINLWGGSYGTRAALVYLRRHGDRVRAVILDGLAPPAIRLPLNMGVDAWRAMERLFEDCESEPDCAAAYPDLRQEYEELVGRLEGSPQPVRAPHPRTGEPLELEFSRQGVIFLLRGALYSAELSRLVPLVIHRANAGDYGPLLALSDPWSEVEAAMSVGMLFSVLCAEDIAWLSEAERQGLQAESFLGAAVLDMWGGVCDFWPRGDLPEGYHDPVASDKPVLVLSGDVDPVTPPRWGEAVAAHLPNSLHVVVPGVAHGTLATGCVPRLMAQFIEEASVEGLDTGCVEELERPLFFHSFTGPRVDAAEGGAP